MAVPKDRRLYDAIASEIKAKYKPSAYRSGLIVKTYKTEFAQRYGHSNAYYGSKDESQGISRWFREDWRNQRGEVGYQKPGDIYRPTRRITEDTPTTFNELTPQQIKAAKKEKAKTGRVKRFDK